MREITSHKVNGLNEAIQIVVVDEPGLGGASFNYKIVVGTIHMYLRFQSGAIQEKGINGVSNEALLAIVEDRLKGFQSGQYACAENAAALDALQECIQWLHARTKERAARGVEGTMTS